jgi:hypothetical protein
MGGVSIIVAFLWFMIRTKQQFPSIKLILSIKILVEDNLLNRICEK